MTGWRREAACAGADPEPFTRDLRGNTIPLDTQAAALRYCAACPVRVACGAEADAGRDVGLRGGVFRLRQYRSSGLRYRRYDLLAGERPYQGAVA